MKTIFLKSMRFRIMISILCAGIIPALVLVTILLYYYETGFTSSEIDGMKSEANLLANEIGSGSYFEENGEVDTLNTEMASVADAYAGRIMVIDSSLKIIYDTYDMYEGRIFLWENIVGSVEGEESSYYDRDNSCLTLTIPIETEDDEGVKYVGALLMTESTEGLENNMYFVVNVALVSGLAVILFSIALAVYLSYIFVKPYYDISNAIDELAHNDAEGIYVNSLNETKEISDSFNKHVEQMQALDKSRQEFVSNVSHELKTPLTSMKVLADSINSMGEGVPVEMYREFMGDIVGEIDRETKIINDLLSLVRMDKSKADLNITAVNINELLEMLLKRLEPIAAKQEVSLVLETFRPVTAEVDEVKFTLAIMNLIENGIKYNNTGGWVHVSVNSDHQYCYIRVEDNGLGIPEEDIDRIFERFFRADKSHSREIGGTGLGLAITYDAIKLHHGEIKVNSTLGEGTTFDVRIPLSYISVEGEEL